VKCLSLQFVSVCSGEEIIEIGARLTLKVVTKKLCGGGGLRRWRLLFNLWMYVALMLNIELMEQWPVVMLAELLRLLLLLW